MSHNLAINTTKWYNLQEVTKIYENYKETKRKIKFIQYSCKKYENIQRKTSDDINEVDDVNFQTGNQIEKQKLFFLESS